MSRKFILGLAAIAMLASTVIVSASANAAPHGIRGNGPAHVNIRGGGHVHVRPPVHRLPPRIIVKGPRFHDHVRIVERGYVRPVGLVQTVTEGPCTCLWKGYTPEGAVVFKDLCTKEMASTPVEGASTQSGELQSAPNNFAGKTYQDYLAANPQQSAEKKN